MNEYFFGIVEILNSPTNTYNHHLLSVVWVILIGLIVGSYLNVVIYRGSAKYLSPKYKGKLTVTTPKKSFCPECLHPLSALENIPVISWIIQGAKCKHCKAPISIQYPLVESSNAILWVLLWKYSPTIGDFLIFSSFASCLIAVTVIDLKTFKIPNKITLSAIGLLLLLTMIISPPNLLPKVLATLGAGVLGLLLVEIGKALFGKKTVKLKFPTPFELDQAHGVLTIEEEGKSLSQSEPIPTNELFVRDSDSITIKGEICAPNNSNAPVNSAQFLILKKDRAILSNTLDNSTANHNCFLPKEGTITGKIKEITMPQEALGMGDTKLLMLIATALGYPYFVYSMTLGAILGLVYALVLRLNAIARKTNPPSLIAFGPWLSLASILVLGYMLYKQ